MNNKKDDDLIQKLKDAFDTVLPPTALGEYPKEAMSIGTYVRSIRHNKLGIITDAFYGELDADNKKIIIYTILLLPNSDRMGSSFKKPDKYYMTNEYEYDVIGYLMIKPVDVRQLTSIVGGELFL